MSATTDPSASLSADASNPFDASTSDATATTLVGAELNAQSATQPSKTTRQPGPSPRKTKPGTASTNESNSKAGRKQDSPRLHEVWWAHTKEGYAGDPKMKDPISADAMVDAYMIPRTSAALEIEKAVVDEIVERCEPVLAAARETLKTGKPPNGVRMEKLMVAPYIKYVEAIVKLFEHKPLVVDSQNYKIPPLDEREHMTAPDVLLTLPGIAAQPGKGHSYLWDDFSNGGEFKDQTSILNANKLNSSDVGQKAAVQLSKDGRSLLGAHGRCNSWTFSICKHRAMRLFCYDRTGWLGSAPFDWLEGNERLLPTFYYRLFHPPGHPGRIDGDDFTIEPVASELDVRLRVHKAIQAHPFYSTMFPTVASSTSQSLRIKAAIRDPTTGESTQVDCISVGPKIAASYGLFSRATRVYRVILERDAEEIANDPAKGPPKIYALKDAWREACRRPEVDYYDFVARTAGDAAVAAGMATCLGAIDLHELKDVDMGVQVTRFLPPGKDPIHHRRIHTRLLLTPVGTPLRNFASTKALASALRDGIRHHKIAFDAGLLHRDISDGNILFVEDTPPGTSLPRAFLSDWDYAEFTEAGATAFNALFPDRQRLDRNAVDRSLKDMTGTRQFLAIALMRIKDMKHDGHHDLESFFWLLMWMVLRHVKHKYDGKNKACGSLFDAAGYEKKFSWLFNPVCISQTKNEGLFNLVTAFQKAVKKQNRDNMDAAARHDESEDESDDEESDDEAGDIEGDESDSVVDVGLDDDENTLPTINLTHLELIDIFEKHLEVKKRKYWPSKDAARVFELPNTETEVDNVLIYGSTSKRKLVAIEEEKLEVSASKRVKMTDGSAARKSASSSVASPTSA
ncbi:hypothetical protein HMN09_00907500 [Mycena chlorophos]|uniref:Fungal-type protein kinase domain-containing protein n=1 Tax=Mycena chlorophos TaxID=658473 RepID=A0A8H6SQ57_MYCCL|nr:hypothetical protein HMN09_00907500 [Mycena chlorophos]